MLFFHSLFGSVISPSPFWRCYYSPFLGGDTFPLFFFGVILPLFFLCGVIFPPLFLCYSLFFFRTTAKGSDAMNLFTLELPTGNPQFRPGGCLSSPRGGYIHRSGRVDPGPCSSEEVDSKWAGPSIMKKVLMVQTEQKKHCASTTTHHSSP